jgi:MscS family membrane protein
MVLHILWFSIPLPPDLAFLGEPIFSFLATALAWVMIAILVNLIFTRLLRLVMRNAPGEIEDIVLGILRKPVLILIIAYGTVQSLQFLELPDALLEFITRLANTVIVLVLVYLSWRVIKDVILYYGKRWALRTESRLDDVILPVLNLIGPLVIVITASLIILPMWGVDVSSILVPAGVIGLVLGLALQDPLSNIFSGISLLIESPFRTGDLIILDDGRTCEVERLGLRSTQFYSVDDHSTIFVPNRSLSNTSLVNITQPTVEQKLTIDINVNIKHDMAMVETKLKEIAIAHPNVLVAEMCEKLPLLYRRIAQLRSQAEALPMDDTERAQLLSDADKFEEAIPKLDLEDHLNRLMLAYQEALRALFRAIQEREIKGLTVQEIKDLLEGYVAPAEEKVQQLVAASNEWIKIPDPWVDHREFVSNRELWANRNEQLRQRWGKLKREIQRPSEDMEMRLDNATQEMLDWLEREYKIPAYYWKTPNVSFVSFDGDQVRLRLGFHVDNIRLEHLTRARRVKTELSRQIREQFIADGIW